jgi:hypothetical protein
MKAKNIVQQHRPYPSLKNMGRDYNSKNKKWPWASDGAAGCS